MLRNLLKDLAKRIQTKPSAPKARRLARTVKPRLEILEDREVPSITLSGMTTFAVGSGAFGTAAADLNGDGKADLIQTNNGDNTISVLLNTTVAGATTPTFSTQQTFATGIGPSAVAVGDMTGDGKLDLAIANYGTGTVSVLVNTTATASLTVSLSAQQTFSVGANPRAVALADINSDGLADIVVSNTGSNTISVLLNTSTTGSTTASFAAQQTVSVGAEPFASIAVGDINGDGRADLVVPNNSNANLSVLLNTTATGSTTASFSQTTFAIGTSPAVAVLTDLNGDGKLDLAVSNWAASQTISILLNTTTNEANTPTFTAQQTFSVAFNPYGIAVGDYDGDGRNDLAVSHSSVATLSVLLNTTVSGSLTSSFTQQTFATGSTPFFDVAADFNNDNRTDIAVANFGSNNVGVFLNTTAFTGHTSFASSGAAWNVAFGDFNGDGRPDMAASGTSVSVLLNTAASGALPSNSRQTFSAGLVPSGVSVGDLNGDGRPDIAVTESSTGTVRVLLNTTPNGATTSSFTLQPSYTVGGTPLYIAIADFNGDGRNDIVASNSASGTVSVLLNNTPLGSNATFFAPQTTFTVGGSPDQLAIGDINGDGRPDIALALGNTTSAVLLNTTSTGATTPSFAGTQTFTVGANQSNGLAMADFNGDGRPDLVVGNSGSANVAVLLNTTARAATSATFATGSTFAVGTTPNAIAVGDLDGDGRPDVAVTNSGANTVSVLLNTTAWQAATPSFAAQATQTTGSNPKGIAIADVNFDGRNDIAFTSAGDNNVGVIRGQLTGPVGSTSIVAVFPGAGIYRHNRSNGVWTQLAGGTPNMWAVDANGDFVATFAVGGTYLYRPSTGFIQISGATAVALAMSSNGLIVAAFNGYGLAEYRQDGSGWRLLTPAIPNTLAVNALGQIACSFPGAGTYFYRQTTGFQLISSATPNILVIDDLANITASYSGGTYIYRQTGGFQLIHVLPASALSVNGDGKLNLEFAGYGLFSYIPNAGFRGLSISSGSRFGLDRWGNTYAAFAGYGCWYLDPVSGWKQFGTGNPSAVVVG